jgi:hypothetical protein
MSAARPVIPAIAAALLLVVSSARAQSDAPLPSHGFVAAAPAVFAAAPSQQLLEIARWRRDYGIWKAWFLRWRSTPEPGVWHTRARRDAPLPPAWLPEMCASMRQDTGPLADGCRDWREFVDADEGRSVVAGRTAQARSQLESPAHTAWWEHVHIDALWPMTQTGSGAFGLAGMHTTMNVTRRLQVFMAPGAIVMRVPSVTGRPTWTAATDWGFSYRLVDFVMPVTRRASALHFNMVRVWVLGAHGVQMPGEMYLAGFSITFRKR